MNQNDPLQLLKSLTDYLFLPIPDVQKYRFDGVKSLEYLKDIPQNSLPEPTILDINMIIGELAIERQAHQEFEAYPLNTLLTRIDWRKYNSNYNLTRQTFIELFTKTDYKGRILTIEDKLHIKVLKEIIDFFELFSMISLTELKNQGVGIPESMVRGDSFFMAKKMIKFYNTVMDDLKMQGITLPRYHAENAAEMINAFSNIQNYLAKQN